MSDKGLRSILGRTNIIVLFSFVLCFSILVITSENHEAAGLIDPGALQNHSALVVDYDNNWGNYNSGVRAGTGTLLDPYLIYNWRINANGSVGIYILSSFKSFKIYNCEIYNMSNHYALEIIWSRDPTMRWNISNCLIHNSTYYYGYVSVTNNLTISNCRVENVKYGILFEYRNCNFDFLSNDIYNISNGVFGIVLNGDTEKMYNSTFDNNTYTNCGGSSGYTFGNLDQAYQRNIKISNNTFDDVDLPGGIIINVRSGFNIKLTDNVIINSGGGGYELLISFTGSYGLVKENSLKNDTNAACGIVIFGDHNLIDNNTIINCIYISLRIQNPGGNNTIRSNIITHTWIQNSYYGYPSIEIYTDYNIVEKNHLYYPTNVGILTHRYLPNHHNIIRNNTVIGSWWYDIDVEHNSTDCQIYDNICGNSWFGIVDEGNDTQIFNNIVNNSEVGYCIHGNGSIMRNNQALNCTYAAIQFDDGDTIVHGVRLGQATGENVHIIDNSFIDCEYGILIFTQNNYQYPRNITIFNNVFTSIAHYNISINGYYDDVIFTNGGENCTMIWPFSFVNNWLNTSNIIFRSNGNNNLNGITLSQRACQIGLLLMGANISFIQPTSWALNTIKVYDINTTAFILWTEGSIEFAGISDHVIDICSIFASFSSIQNSGYNMAFISNSIGFSLTYLWDFDDGSNSTVENPSHTYSLSGTYNVTLTVTDEYGATNSTFQTVTILSPAEQVGELIPVVIAITSVVLVVIVLSGVIIGPFARLFRKMW